MHEALRDRDPLTSSVVARLSYLPTAVAWALVGDAIDWTSGWSWPAAPPPGSSNWRFTVEPDVVWTVGPLRIAIDAKHDDSRTAEEWGRGAREADAAFVVGLGGKPPIDADRLPFLCAHIPWDGLTAACVRLLRDRTLPEHQRRIANDLIAALEVWGHPVRSFFGDLGRYTRPGGFDPVALEIWSP